jgi:hypothetical protein
VDDYFEEEKFKCQVANGRITRCACACHSQRDEARGQNQNFRKETSKISNCRMKETDRRRMGGEGIVLEIE